MRLVITFNLHYKCGLWLIKHLGALREEEVKIILVRIFDTDINDFFTYSFQNVHRFFFVKKGKKKKYFTDFSFRVVRQQKK